MERVILQNTDEYGNALRAEFLPEMGMNLCSLRSGPFEAIAQSTYEQFETRYSGLGPIIGPHFHTATSYRIPSSIDTFRFPHMKILKEMGRADMFSHGIGRYAPWKYAASQTTIRASLTSEMLLHSYPLRILEGDEFEMHYEARLIPSGLVIKLSVTSRKPSVIGLHYYLAKEGDSTIHSRIKNVLKGEIPPDFEWDHEGSMKMKLGTQSSLDHRFSPIKTEGIYKAVLQNRSYELNIEFLTGNELECCMQIYSPYGSDYICIEPLSAVNPEIPTLTHSTVECKLEIIPRQKV